MPAFIIITDMLLAFGDVLGDAARTALNHVLSVLGA